MLGFKNKRTIIWLGVLFAFFAGGMASCKKSETLGSDPYNHKVKPLVKFLDIDPDPASGVAGSNVTFYVSGLTGKDSSQFQFYINQEKAKIVSIVDSAVTVIVPMTAGSGAASVLINGENYFGPIFNVDGYVRIDPTFKPGSGVGQFGMINDILKNSDNTCFLVGSFKDYDGKATATAPISDIVKITASGEYKAMPEAGKAVTAGVLNAMLYTNGQYFIGGGFSAYNVRDGINNITRIFNDASLDTMVVELVNLDPENRPNDSYDTVPTFNGGVGGGAINHLFYDGTGVVAVGNFQQYYSYYYYRSTVGSLVLDRYNVTQLVRMSEEGVLDSAYNIDPLTGIGYSGANGFILDATQLSNGNIIIAGSFNKFNGAPVGHIAMLADDGLLDASFNSWGSGADGEVTKITYNANTHHIMLTGAFKKYNGIEAPGVVMLNEDGTMASNFHFGALVGGVAQFAAQLSNGLVLVTGTFTGYNGIYRQGMIFLNDDGSLAAGYNNMGSFVGRVNKILEAPTDLGTFGVILVGSFNLIDNQTAGGIAKLEVL